MTIATRLAAWLFAVLVSAAGPMALAAQGNTGIFSARFVETRTLPGFDQPLVSHGNVRVGPGHRFHWEVTAPYHYRFDMHDGTAVEKLPDGTQRTLRPDQTPWLEAVERLFTSALAGNVAALRQHFSVAIKPLGKGRHVTLIPKSGSAMARVVARIEVTENAQGHPSHLVIVDSTGAHMDIRFQPMDTPPGA